MTMYREDAWIYSPFVNPAEAPMYCDDCGAEIPPGCEYATRKHHRDYGNYCAECAAFYEDDGEELEWWES